MPEPTPQRLSAIRRISLIFLVAAVGASLMSCGPEPEPVNPMDQKSTIQLSGVVVGVVGLGVLFQNHTSETLEHVRIVVNEGSPDREYKFEIKSIIDNSTQKFLIRAFRNEDGISLDPKNVDVRSMTVYASTSKGRGSWRGTYPAPRRRKPKPASDAE